MPFPQFQGKIKNQPPKTSNETCSYTSAYSLTDFSNLCVFFTERNGLFIVTSFPSSFEDGQAIELNWTTARAVYNGETQEIKIISKSTIHTICGARHFMAEDDTYKTEVDCPENAETWKADFI